MNGAPYVRIDRSSVFHCGNDRREIVVCEDNIACLLGNISTAYTHRASYVSLFQCRRIVDTVAGHGNGFAAFA